MHQSTVRDVNTASLTPNDHETPATSPASREARSAFGTILRHGHKTRTRTRNSKTQFKNPITGSKEQSSATDNTCAHSPSSEQTFLVPISKMSTSQTPC